MEIIKRNNLIFKVALTDEIDEEYKKDFIKVCCQVFGEQSMDKFLFERKFVDNIYGESILIVAYENNYPVACRAFWRNDLNGIKAYQPGNTAVLKEYRGRGIFREMTCIALDKIDGKDFIYNFPNQNSYNLYLKLGWKNYVSYYTNILTSVKKYKEEHPEIIDNEYLKWWFVPQSHKYYVLYKGKDLFLIKKRVVSLKKIKLVINFIIGRINPEQTRYFRRLTSPIPFLFYYGSESKIYNKKRMPRNIVYKPMNSGCYVQIPVYKMDAI